MASKKYFSKEKSKALIRLNKYIANSGACNRREADAFISQGLVKVNGKVVKELGKKVLNSDKVMLEDELIFPGKKVYVLLNKPKGFACKPIQGNDKKVSKLVKNAFEDGMFMLHPMEKDDRGLMVLSNDKKLVERSSAYSAKVKALYKIELNSELKKEDFNKIKEGFKIGGVQVVVSKIAYTDESKRILGIEIQVVFTIYIKQLFVKLGYQIEYLDRVLYADFSKKNLSRGQWRFLNDKEVERLNRLT